MIQAEALLHQQDSQENAARLELQKALYDAKNVAAARGTVWRMREIKDRLIAALKSARRFGIPESELHEADARRRRIHNLIEDAKGQIRVFCRVRPINNKESSQGDTEALQIIDDMSLEVPKMGAFSYDCVFAPGSQEDVFEECRDLIQSAVDGHNVTIFTYGQTGAGKTYTLYGNAEQEGIAPRSIAELFKIIDNIRSRYVVSVTCSMFEVYNNQLIDLMRPSGNSAHRRRSTSGRETTPLGSPKLSLRQDRSGNMQVDHLAEHEVQDAQQLKMFLERGMAQRTVAANAMNIESSRSHLIFTIRVNSMNRETKELLKGKILLCDLGGSERLKKTEATGEQKKEAIEINKSLTALGDVIEAVAKKQKQVPYRNHKLTQIMQDSLGGTAKALMFVNCSPASSSLDETIMSLKYAARVKKITNWASPSHSPMRSAGGTTTPTPQGSPLLSEFRDAPAKSSLNYFITQQQQQAQGVLHSPAARSTPSSRSPSAGRRKTKTDKGERLAESYFSSPGNSLSVADASRA